MNERRTRYTSTMVAGLIAGSLAFSYSQQAASANPIPAAAATAKPDLAAAKRHYADGERKFKAGDFAGALEDFRAANEIKSTAQAERYIGLCEDSLGHRVEAAAWYDKFLVHVPEKMAAQGDEVRRRSAEIKALPGKVHIDSNPPGAAVTIDGRPHPAPTPTDVDLTPGPHTIRLSEQGRLPAEKPVDVAFASTQNVTADLDPEPASPAPPPPAPVAAMPAAPLPPPPPSSPRSKVPALVTGVVAIAAAGVGTVFGVMALNDKSDYDKNPTEATANDGDTHALIADMAFGVALTFGLTSTFLLLTKDEQSALPATASAEKRKDNKSTGVGVTPTPWIAPHSGGAGLVLRF